jgi:exopolysaccharide biosynthesis operon protein EpsL
VRNRVYAKIPVRVLPQGSARGGRTPRRTGRMSKNARTRLKKLPTIRPILTATAVCLVPLAVQAQTQGPSQPSTPTAPSVPSTPTLPTTPSQAVGVPYPSSVHFPGRSFQPAGTQASTVYDEVGPGVQFRAMAGVEHESNVLRTPDNEVSDTAFLLGVGLRAEALYGLQRLRADVEANTYRYDDRSSLNYNVFNYALAWDWSITPRFHGVVAADRKQYRDVSTDPLALVNRIQRRTEREERVEGVYELGASLRLLGGASHRKAFTSGQASWEASPSVNSVYAGVGYELASGTSVYLRHRNGKGEYRDTAPGAVTGDFDDRETEVLLRWPITGKTSIDARLGHLERDHDNAPARDFSGMVGSATVVWDATGKTRLVAGASRDLSATGQGTGGYVENNRFFIGPVWKATEQITVNLRLDRVSRDWRDVPAGSPEVGRDEAVRILSAAVEWAPRRWLSVTGYVRGERQKSNLNSGYRNTTVGAAVKAFF